VKLGIIIEEMLQIYCFAIIFELFAKVFESYLIALDQSMHVGFSYFTGHALFGPLVGLFLAFSFDLGYSGVWASIVWGHWVYINLLCFRIFRFRLKDAIDAVYEKYWAFTQSKNFKVTVVNNLRDRHM